MSDFRETIKQLSNTPEQYEQQLMKEQAAQKAIEFDIIATGGLLHNVLLEHLTQVYCHAISVTPGAAALHHGLKDVGAVLYLSQLCQLLKLRHEGRPVLNLLQGHFYKGYVGAGIGPSSILHSTSIGSLASLVSIYLGNAFLQVVALAAASHELIHGQTAG